MKAKTPFALLTEKKLRTGIVKPQMSQIKQILGCAMFSRDELTRFLSPPRRWFLPSIYREIEAPLAGAKISVTLNVLTHRELGVTVKLFFLQNLYRTELVLPRFTSASNRGK